MFTDKLRVLPDVVGDGSWRFAAIIDPPRYAEVVRAVLTDEGIITHSAQVIGDFILTVANGGQWESVLDALSNPDVDRTPDFSGNTGSPELV